ncbi:hypothetical protein ACUXK4_003977 [Methylorubrum extorquens]
MRRVVPVIVFLATLAGTPTLSGSLDAEVRARNALSDMARAQRDQAESLRQIERVQRDQARRADQDRLNAQRDARSMRRFGR